MPEEQNSQSTNKPKRTRSRTSRKRRRSRQSQGGESTSTAPSKSPAAKERGGDERRDRRRRRRRSRSQSPSSAAEPVVEMAPKDTLDARLPEDVFVYTHVIRSSALDTYGFRPDPFHNRSRGLADFRIDLSPLFPGEAAEDAPIYDAALHGAITFSPEDESDDESDDEEPVDDESDDKTPDEAGV